MTDHLSHLSQHEAALRRRGAARAEKTALRDAFVRRLTVDGPTLDRRRRDYNQAIFAPEEEGGYAVFTRTDLGMILDAFDAAVRDVTGGSS